ncbi:MAG: lyase family protein [Brevinematales bacterium]|nr:lyase family protein [Brevinematales bacterium]
MKYGPQTVLAVQNFGEGRTPPCLVKAYAEVKKACVMAIQKTEQSFSPPVYESILQALDEVIQGQWNDEFVVPLQQGGAGTSLNMNINEVVASRATEILSQTHPDSTPIHPLEHINRYQSTNDTLPTAITLCLLRDLSEVEKKVVTLQSILVEKESTYGLTLIMGRTELQDALPMMLGQIFGSWAGMIERDRWRLHKLKDRIRLIALGGTAVGTGFPAPQAYVHAAEQFLREITGLPIARSQNLPDAIAHHDDWSELASGYLLLAKNLEKMANDFLFYTSSFCGEMEHPELQYGSTLMAAKSNPILLEWIKGMCLRASHLSHLIEDYHSEGNLQLNAFVPFMAEALFEIAYLLKKSLDGMLRFLSILQIKPDALANHIHHSKAVLNLLLPLLGYTKTKEIVSQMPPLSDLASLQTWLLSQGISQEIVTLLEPPHITRLIRNFRQEKNP